MLNTPDENRTKLVRVLNGINVRSDHAIQILAYFDLAVFSARIHEQDRILANMKKLSERGETVSP